MPVATPPLIPQPFAESGDRTAIPNTTAAVGRASFAEGFPAETMQPKIAGGVPPDGRDMNGILYALSAHASYVQAGQPYKFDAAVVAAIAGYAVGTLLGSSDGSTVWLNLTNGNTTDPDASGAGWVPFGSYGSSAITGLVGGSYTLTNVEARHGTIVLSGALVANQIIILPADLRSWRIVNSTTGSFTVTVKTASGTGVTVPQGGYPSSVGVFGDGTNVYLEVPPVSLPIDVNPTADTLLMRNNVGDGFVRYIVGSSAAESFTAANVIATNASDGYFRKISLTDLFGQMALGVNQTWQNVTSSRAVDTVYTNSTGRPIQVAVCVSLPNFVSASLVIGGVTVGSNSAGASAEVFQISAVVPPGSTYIVYGPSGYLDNWSELR